MLSRLHPSTIYYIVQRSSSPISTLPICALFKEAKYKNKRPLPENNFNVAVEGIINGFEHDSYSARQLNSFMSLSR